MKAPKYIPTWFRNLCEERAYALKLRAGILCIGYTGYAENAFVRMCWKFYWNGYTSGQNSASGGSGHIVPGHWHKKGPEPPKPKHVT